jgi:hypothetical protein
LEIGVDHKFVYGAADDPKEVDRIVSFCRAAHMKGWLNMSTLGAFGGRGMGQTCGAADPSQWMKMFGVDIDSRDTTELIRTAQQISNEELEAIKPRIAELFGGLPQASAVNERSIRIYLAIKKLVADNGWDFYTIQSFPGLGDDYTATCFAQSMMLEDGCGASTLGDFNTALSVLLLGKFSGQPVYYGDLQHIDKSNNEIKIIGDGACPPSLAGKLGPAGFAEHGIPTEGEAGGLSVKLVCKVGEGALARLGRVDGKRAARSSSRRPTSWTTASSNAASPSGRTASSRPIAISIASWKTGPMNTPAWPTAKRSWTTSSISAN